MGAHGLTPNEIFNSNYDYEQAAELRNNPPTNGLRLLGRVARLFTRTDENAKRAQDTFDAAVQWWGSKVRQVNQMRLREKAERKANGSLDDIAHLIEKVESPQLEPKPVLGAPGVYRSQMTPHEEPPEPSPDEMHDIMQAAVQRARANLGALPIMRMHSEPPPEPELPPLQDPNAPLPARIPTQPHAKFGEALPSEPDEALLSRLRKAYGDERTPEPNLEESQTESSAPRPRSHRHGPHRMPPHIPKHRQTRAPDSTNA